MRSVTEALVVVTVGSSPSSVPYDASQSSVHQGVLRSIQLLRSLQARWCDYLVNSVRDNQDASMFDEDVLLVLFYCLYS